MSDSSTILKSHSLRNLGSIKAEYDHRFAQHYVNSADFMRLIDDKCMIVTGAKGSGKTAVLRAISEIYPSRYAAVDKVSLDGIKFGPIFSAIQKLNNTSNIGYVSIARTTWQNVIGIHSLEGLLNKNAIPKHLRSDVRKYLQESGHLGTPTTDKFGGQLERVWALVSKWSREHEQSESPPIFGLTAKQLSIMGAFPSDSKLEKILRTCMSHVHASGKKLQLCFDGFDSIAEHTLESRDIIFAGLIDAAYKCSTHPIFMNSLSLKILLPKELTHGARRLLRDLDKMEEHFEAIHWNETNLAEFLRKRLEHHLRIRNRPFDEVWREFFPEKIKNDAHGTDEDTYLYILRHTLYRPRQLLTHIQNILDTWDKRENTNSFKVDPTFIPNAVAESNLSLAQHVVNELLLDLPNLEAFLKSFRGSACTIPWSEVRAKIERHLGKKSEELEDVFTDLYNHGILGISQENKKQINYFRFGFMTPNVEKYIFGNVTDQTVIALSPMFLEYCGCRPSTTGIIVPSK